MVLHPQLSTTQAHINSQPLPPAPTLLPQLTTTPIQAEALAEEYVREEAAYCPGASDIFSLLRARLRSDPVLTQRCFDACDDDKDGRIVGKQVCAVCIGVRMQPVTTTRTAAVSWGSRSMLCVECGCVDGLEV